MIVNHLNCLSAMLQVGGLMKRLDTGEGSYGKELEEDYEVLDAMGQVRSTAYVWHDMIACSSAAMLPHRVVFATDW